MVKFAYKSEREKVDEEGFDNDTITEADLEGDDGFMEE